MTPVTDSTNVTSLDTPTKTPTLAQRLTEPVTPPNSLDALLNTPQLAPEKEEMDSNSSPGQEAYNQSLDTEYSTVTASIAGKTPVDALKTLENEENADNDQIQSLKDKASKLLNKVKTDQANGTLTNGELDSATKEMDAIQTQEQTLFKGVIVIGLVALWTMASVMNNAIDSTQDSQNLTQSLQETMTQAGLAWSNLYSTALQGQAQLITSESTGTDTTNTKSMRINALTSKFNQINSDSQASSSFTSGLTNAINNAISQITQSIQIDIQNVQQGVQKLFDAIAQFQ